MLDTKKNLEIHTHIPAKPEKVFDAWIRQEAMGWYCPEDMTVISAESDPMIRGKYRVSMRADDGKVYTFDGMYEELVPNRKLVFTHQWEVSDPVETHVTVEFTEDSGGTQVTLKHEGIATEELAMGHKAGWSSTLRNLAKQLSKPAPADEGPRPLSEHGLARPPGSSAVSQQARPSTSPSRKAPPLGRADDRRTAARGSGRPRPTPVGGVQQRPDQAQRPDQIRKP
jgi:uncharacterized protein YndB with AHSA1/START domain